MEPLNRLTLAVGSSGKFGIFAFRTCATLEKWSLSVEAISIESVTNSSFTFSLSLGLTNYTVNALPCFFHVGSRLKKIMRAALFSSIY